MTNWELAVVSAILGFMAGFLSGTDKLDSWTFMERPKRCPMCNKVL